MPDAVKSPPWLMREKRLDVVKPVGFFLARLRDGPAASPSPDATDNADLIEILTSRRARA